MSLASCVLFTSISSLGLHIYPIPRLNPSTILGMPGLTALHLLSRVYIQSGLSHSEHPSLNPETHVALFRPLAPEDLRGINASGATDCTCFVENVLSVCPTPPSASNLLILSATQYILCLRWGAPSPAAVVLVLQKLF